MERRDWGKHQVLIGVLTLAATIVVGLATPEMRHLLRIEYWLNDTQVPQPKITPQPTPTPVTVATDISQLRQQHDVELINELASGEAISFMTRNSYGFAHAESLIHDDWRIRVRQGRSKMLSIKIYRKKTVDSFEIHRLASGEYQLIGYIAPDTFEGIHNGLKHGEHLSITTAMSSATPILVGISFYEINCRDIRELSRSTAAERIFIIDCTRS